MQTLLCLLFVCIVWMCSVKAKKLYECTSADLSYGLCVALVEVDGGCGARNLSKIHLPAKI